MSILIFDGALEVNVYYEESDREYEDNICIRLVEDCPEEERVLKYGDTSLYITPDQAALLLLELQRALTEYRASNPEI